jgi:nicotinamidase-related amidase
MKAEEKAEEKAEDMLDLDPQATALVLIDLQKGLLGLPTAPYPAAQVVENGGRLARALATAGGTVVLVRVDFGEGVVAAPKGGTDTPLALPPGGVPADWAELAPELAAVRPHIIITKRQWSAFFGTELDLQLRRRGITHMIVGGLMTNFGVESTARDGWQHNYTVVVAEDAAASFGEDLHRFAVEKTLPRVGLVRKTDAILAALSRSQAA